MAAKPRLLLHLLPFLLPSILIAAPPSVAAQRTRLPAAEVRALGEIAKQLLKTDWDLGLDPCGNDSSWKTPAVETAPLYNNSITCDCNFTRGHCHVFSVFLKGEDLAGVLPPAMAKLPYLKALDLNRNYLSGSIPAEWTSLKKLVFLSLSVNRLSGPIPPHLGKITSLRYLSIENNYFSGTIPVELGNLVNLESLTLSANNLTGDLHPSLTKLSNLIELRISSNSFRGKFPDVFQSWKKLQRLEIQASGFKGPLPSSISVLGNLTELRISDMDCEGSVFPKLRMMTGRPRLMLRNCNISGPIPQNIAEMTEIQILDLSFNKLEGNITSFDGLRNAEILYLTNNLLTGPIPDSIKSRNNRFQTDLSDNHFFKNSMPSNCEENLNLFRSYSGGKGLELDECQERFPCSEDRYSLHINCGGLETTVEKTTYEADDELGGPSYFVPRRVFWGFSNTGDFWGRRQRKSTDYIANNVSTLRMNNSQLFTTARLSPLSLTYYGRCLVNGNYTVKLHFAEIIIRGNRSFYSLGRRIFDVYIQERRVVKDFNIAEKAKGVDKPFVAEFKAVLVSNKTLLIRFQWAGKGTTASPIRGTYGPLISAISVKSEFSPPRDDKKKFIAAGVVSSGLVLIFVVLGILWWKRYHGSRTSMAHDLRGLDLQTGSFSFAQIKAATNKFDAANKIGEGGFGSVYKGTLLDGMVIAVKQLSGKSKQGTREFVNEIGTMSALRHPNLVRLYGCCVEREQLLLVYEYMENNSLAHVLFGPRESRLILDWPTRQRICVGIARGLAFLHEESVLKIIHRDIKATNVLLDVELNPKISDFGLAKLDEQEHTHISTRIAGTIGYMAPEYALWGFLTHKADVYSFGVVALEIVAGKHNIKFRPDENFVCLLDWALVLQQKGKLMEVVDPDMGADFKEEEAERMLKVALACTNPSPALRPVMSAVVRMLEGQLAVEEACRDPGLYGDESHFEALRNQSNEMQIQGSTESRSLVRSMVDGSSSTSTLGF